MWTSPAIHAKYQSCKSCWSKYLNRSPSADFKCQLMMNSKEKHCSALFSYNKINTKNEMLTILVGDVVRDVNFSIGPLIPQAFSSSAWVSVFVGIWADSNVSFNQGRLIKVRVCKNTFVKQADCHWYFRKKNNVNCPQIASFDAY